MITHESWAGMSAHGEDVFSLAQCTVCRPLLIELLRELLTDEQR